MEKTKIDPQIFGLAGAIAAVLWMIYSGSLFLLSFLTIWLFSDLGNVDLFNFEWRPPLVKYILVMYLLMFGASVTGKIISSIYNLLIGKFDTKLL